VRRWSTETQRQRAGASCKCIQNVQIFLHFTSLLHSQACPAGFSTHQGEASPNCSDTWSRDHGTLSSWSASTNTWKLRNRGTVKWLTMYARQFD
jgi:hypothetical protein